MTLGRPCHLPSRPPWTLKRPQSGHSSAGAQSQGPRTCKLLWELHKWDMRHPRAPGDRLAPYLGTPPPPPPTQRELGGAGTFRSPARRLIYSFPPCCRNPGLTGEMGSRRGQTGLSALPQWSRTGENEAGAEVTLLSGQVRDSGRISGLQATIFGQGERELSGGGDGE